jgi:hypothetical protein
MSSTRIFLSDNSMTCAVDMANPSIGEPASVAQVLLLTQHFEHKCLE